MTTNMYLTDEAKRIVKGASVGRAQLLKELRGYRLTSAVKNADLGGDPSAGFEQSFASLAYGYVQEKAPALADYMIGFQLVDKNEDNTKSVGIFGFKIGEQWAYVPVFFINGNLKGHELLFLKNQDTFVPLKENWVNHLLAKKPHVLGSPSRQKPQDMGELDPDYKSMAIPPIGNKYSSIVVPPSIKKWAMAAMKDVANWATKAPTQNNKYAGLDDRLDLRKFLKQDVSVVKLAMDIVGKYPSIKVALDDMYGKNLFKDVLLDLHEQAIAAEKQSVLKPRSNTQILKSGILGKSAAADKAPKVDIKTDVVTTDNTEMSDSEREKLLRDGYLVKDHRTGDEVSVAYNTQVGMALTNPDATDVFDVLVKPYGFERCLVVHNPQDSTGRRRMCVVVSLAGDKDWENIHATKVFVKEQERGKSDIEEYKAWFDKLDNSKGSIQKGACYLILSQNGSGTAVFEAREDLGDNTWRVSWQTHGDNIKADYIPDCDENRNLLGGLSRPACIDGDVIYFNERKGTGFRSISGKLYIPAEAKVMKVKDAPSCRKCDKKEDDCTCDYFSQDYSMKRQPIKPGNLADLQMEILEKTSELKVFCDGTEVVINRQRMSKLAGLFHLIKGHGLREKQAKRIIKEAERFNGAKFRIKYADMYSAMEGPGAPGFPGVEYGMEQAGRSSFPTMDGPQVSFQDIPELSAANTDPSTYDPMDLVDPMALQSAQEAQQQGQKDVFDTAMISSMLKAVRQDSIVERYLGDLMKALDRLGRILFMFYWHNEEFISRYGKQDMPELEDTIRNAFEVLGDLVLYLKQKTIDGGSGSDVTDGLATA